jgi:hypothetical protein
MPKRSLFSQFNQIRGSLSFEDLITYMSSAEDAGRSYLSGTLAVVSGSATVTDSGNVFGRPEQNNYVMIDTGDAAGLYQITACSGTYTAVVSPTPTASDATASYRRHYYQNLEDDLNYLRTIVKAITGETNWYDVPPVPLNEKADQVDLVSASGTLQSQIDNLDNIYATDVALAAVSGTLQTEIDGKSDIGHNHDLSYDPLGAASSAVSAHELAYDHTSFATHSEVSSVSGTLQTQITNNASAISDLDAELTTASGYLQSEIDSLNLDFATDAELAAVSGTLQGEIDSIATDLSSNYYTKTELDAGQLDNRYYTETETDSLLSTLSGTLQTEIDGKSDLGHTHTESEITDLDKYTKAEVDSMFSVTSGTLQDQLDALDDTYATDAELAAVSGTLQSEIDYNSTAITNLDIELTTASGYLQDQIDALDCELASVSGSLQTDITNLTTTVNNNYTTLDNKIDTTSGTLQSAIEDLDTSLTDAIIWEVVDTPTIQIRPKAAHQGKAIYSAGNLTIGGDLTVSGTTTTIHSEELTVTDKIITVNDGEVGAGITGSQYAGIEVDRGSETNYQFVFDEVQDNFRVGISGSLQAVATREDTPTDQYVAFWNAAATRFDTAGGISVSDIASETFVSSSINTLSGTLQGEIDDLSSDLSSNYYTKAALDGGQLDNRYYTETEINNNYYTESEVDALFASLSGTVSGDYYTKSEIDTFFTSYSTTSQMNSAISSALVGYATESYVSSALSSYSTTSEMNSAIASALTSYYTSAQVDSLLAAQNAFLELEDVDLSSYSAGRVLFTTASGVTDDANFTFDSVSGTLNTPYLSLESGVSVNEIVTTVTSGTTDSQIPTAKAVWDLTEAAAAAVHSHADEDATYVSNTSWTYGTGLSAVPDSLQIFVNGVKQRIGSSYDCTVDVPGGVLTITFLYSVYSDSWVNVTYIY